MPSLPAGSAVIGAVTISGTPNVAVTSLPEVVTVDHPHEEIHDGDSFTYQDVITLGSAATQDYLLTVANTTKWPQFVFEVEGTFGITVELYEGADRTGTSAQSIINRNRNSATTAGMTVHKGTSGGTTDGTRIQWTASGSGTAAGRQAGVRRDVSEMILDQNVKYIFRVTSDANNNRIAVKLDWYEHVV
jgi:hypothetical protein